MIYKKPDPEIPGFMRDEELDWLFEQAQRMSTIAEIGSLKGRSVHALCSGCPGIVVAIDKFLDDPNHEIQTNVFQEFLSNTASLNNLLVARMDSRAAALRFSSWTFEMVFIDGDHCYPGFMEDLLGWRYKATKLLCGHDCNNPDTPDIPRVLSDLNVKYTRPCNNLWAVEIG